ncbi:unnamed protein product [Diatraea saccharalis]|uniref:Serine/threonine-protein kinase receptor n=1 Tax=Diatraea saccharalis TaxID=40085 RepID=A0A9N9RD38_9NEOP|nr:unnamed protein product [Diatraea saccharalis]
MMEGILTQKVTPLLKCIVLFLFIFTAKVLTSRPQESQDFRSDLHHSKPSHYVRTFTKYHHRRTIQWNNPHELYWPSQDLPKSKRSIDTHFYWPEKSRYPGHAQPKIIRKKRNIPYSNLISGEVQHYRIIPRNKKRSVGVINDFTGSKKVLKQFVDSDVGYHETKIIASGTSNKDTSNGKNGLITSNRSKEKNIFTTAGSPIQCLYKLHRVSISVTPSYKDEKNAQIMVENNSHDIGVISESVLPNGETALVEQCTDIRATCYALWHRNQDGNVTVLGQGCWHSSQRDGQNTCDKCTPIDQMESTKFCCCTKPYCNADFLSLREETVTIKAESTMNTVNPGPNYSRVVASVILAIVAIVVTIVLIRKLYCKRSAPDKQELSLAGQVEKGDIMGTGPDALATGLLCVDNLTLIEHIGQGKFGSVWRGSLGSTPVAVKLYSNANAWQKEAAIYALPHLSHPNILKYYGSDTRASLTDCGRSRLVVLELCVGTLRDRLQRAPLSWREYAAIAHGLAAAIAHLHAPVGNKPCIVHRDVNSNNVLITSNGQARLADLGLAQVLHARREKQPSRITEAGTLRYLSPEALEGALDLSGARAALCAVDVFALGLVLWESLWRCSGAHPGSAPTYMQPYGHLLPDRPTLQQMQTLVSRNKSRPPLPKGPVPETRALKIATDTCEECWDHDAEARLTAVCVEERMAELKQMLQTQGPVIHDNKLHPHPPDTNIPEMDKNSNCTSGQTSDPAAPLLARPEFGRNACIERNTHTNTQSHTVQLIHKSLKDITATEVKPQRVEENCLSVARTHRPLPESSDRLNEIRSYQRPLEYIPNDVSSHEDRGPKSTNLLQEVKVEKPKWGIRKFFERLNKKMDTEVKLMPETSTQNGKTKTSIIEKCNNFDRPSNLVLNQDSIYNIEGPCTLSPPNRTLSPTMMIESDMNRENNVFGFRELPNDDAKNQCQIFAVIVPKAKPDAESHSKTAKSSDDSIDKFKTSMSSQSIFKNHSESEDSTVKKRLSSDNKITQSGGSSRASINLELQYINNQEDAFDSPFDLNSDCSSSEDEHLMLLSENGGSKITMQAIPKDVEKKKFQNDVLKEASQVTDFGFNKYQNKYTNFDNEFSYSNDKENLGYSGDNPVYLAALNGEIDTTDMKYLGESENKSPKPFLKSLSIKRQRSLEQVSEIFTSSGDLNLLNPAGRVKTPGDLPVAVRRARRDRALQKGRASESNRLSLYDDRMMFGNSL